MAIQFRLILGWFLVKEFLTWFGRSEQLAKFFDPQKCWPFKILAPKKCWSKPLCRHSQLELRLRLGCANKYVWKFAVHETDNTIHYQNEFLWLVLLARNNNKSTKAVQSANIHLSCLFSWACLSYHLKYQKLKMAASGFHVCCPFSNKNKVIILDTSAPPPIKKNKIIIIV